MFMLPVNGHAAALGWGRSAWQGEVTDSTASSLFTGIGAVPGRAEGRVLRLRLPAPLPTPPAPAADRDGERARLARALGRADGELQVEARAARRRGALEAAAILDAHRALVTDPVLARELDLAVAAGERAQDAVRRALARWAERLEASSDPTLRSRADDLRDLARRLERLLVAGPPPPPEAGADPCIVVADGLGPSDVVRLDPHRVRGLVLEGGGPYGHAVIAARSLGLPTVVAVGPLPDWVEGRHAVLDGDAGWVRVGGADVPPRPVAGGTVATAVSSRPTPPAWPTARRSSSRRTSATWLTRTAPATPAPAAWGCGAPSGWGPGPLLPPRRS